MSFLVFFTLSLVSVAALYYFFFIVISIVSLLFRGISPSFRKSTGTKTSKKRRRRKCPKNEREEAWLSESGTEGGTTRTRMRRCSMILVIIRGS